MLHRCKLPAGTGPRHLSQSRDGSKLLVGGELGNSVTVLHVARCDGSCELSVGASCSVLPANYVPPGTGSTVSHIELLELPAAVDLTAGVESRGSGGGLVFVGNRVGVGMVRGPAAASSRMMLARVETPLDFNGCAQLAAHV